MNKKQNNPIPEKRNPLLDNVAAIKQPEKKEKARAVRIRESSFQYLRKYAFENDTTMIEAVEEAIMLLRLKEKK